MKKKKTFLISPVRGHAQSEYTKILEELENKYQVYLPIRDTNQNDDTGLNICKDNLEAIKKADVVHFIWDGKSQGCLFDLGMAFALKKKIIPLSLPELTEGKSFQNMITEYSKCHHEWHYIPGSGLGGDYHKCKKCGKIE